MAQLRSIAAAGGVVWRLRHGVLEIAVVHRPRYDDWTLPKGKVIDGESLLAAAVREVGEELGAEVVVSRRIGRMGYDMAGVRKNVTYWVMCHVGGEFSRNDEVDEVEWATPAQARNRLTYGVDRLVTADFAAVPVPDSVIILVRHAKAGKRSDWAGRDDLRPLDEVGRAQARRLVSLLRAFAPNRVISAEPVRCVQTVEPAAKALGVRVRIDSTFSDAGYLKSRWDTETALLSLAKPGKVSVVCSQGLTIPRLIDRLAQGVRSSDTRKGAAWVLSIVDGTVVSADYYDDATR